MTESWDIDLPATSEGDATDLVINAQGFAVTVQPRPTEKQANAEATVITFDNGVNVLVRLSKGNPNVVVVQTFGVEHATSRNVVPDNPSAYKDVALGQARSHIEFTVRT